MHWITSTWLNLTRSIELHMCVTSFTASHTSMRFALQSATFESQLFLRQVRRITPKWPWTLQGQVTIYPLLKHPSPNFQLILLYNWPVSSYRPLLNKWTECQFRQRSHIRNIGSLVSLYHLPFRLTLVVGMNPNIGMKLFGAVTLSPFIHTPLCPAMYLHMNQNLTTVNAQFEQRSL